MPEFLDNGDSMAPSPQLMRPGDTGLLVVDVQPRLLQFSADQQRITWNIRRLVDGAQTLGVRLAATEQSPEKLGGTLESLAERLPAIPSKQRFSCVECAEIFKDWIVQGIHRVLLCGIETHVCIQQTALDLLAAGFEVFIAVDATGSRNLIDQEIALRRMESSGVSLTTTEAALFEWCGAAGTDEFRSISELVKESPPT